MWGEDVHGLQSFLLTHSGKNDSVLFTLSSRKQMLLTSAFSKQNSVISLEEWVFVFKLFTIAIRKLKVKFDRVYITFTRALFHWLNHLPMKVLLLSLLLDAFITENVFFVEAGLMEVLCFAEDDGLLRHPEDSEEAAMRWARTTSRTTSILWTGV